MEKQRDSRIVALVALVVAVIGTTVAFATLSSTLTIGGADTNVVVDARWKIEFTNVNASTTGQAVVGTTPIINATDTTKIDDYAATLKAPGDSVTVTFTVTNNGTIDAKLAEITKAADNALTCTSLKEEPETADATKVCGKLTYELVDATTNQAIVANDTTSNLAVNGSKTMKLILTYDKDGTITSNTDLPTDKVSITGLGVSLKYDQQ